MTLYQPLQVSLRRHFFFTLLGGKWAARTKRVPVQGSKAREERWLTMGHRYRKSQAAVFCSWDSVVCSLGFRGFCVAACLLPLLSLPMCGSCIPRLSCLSRGVGQNTGDFYHYLSAFSRRDDALPTTHLTLFLRLPPDLPPKKNGLKQVISV